MTVGYPPHEEQLASVVWETTAYESYPDAGYPMPIRVDALAIALLVLALFLAIQLLTDSQRGVKETIREDNGTIQIEPDYSETGKNNEEIEISPENLVPAAPPIDSATIVYPYDEYWVTQGPHGMSYGHLAIDLAAGKGTVIKSPIQGVVSANYIDQYGNTTLILDNERYTITLLHGDYPLPVGQEVSLGQDIGTESNHGYTTDMYGNYCGGRDCGHHTHLNVYDKTLGQNVNPLEVLRP